MLGGEGHLDWGQCGGKGRTEGFSGLYTPPNPPPDLCHSLSGQLGSRRAQGRSPGVLWLARGRAGGWVMDGVTDHASVTPLWGVKRAL